MTGFWTTGEAFVYVDASYLSPIAGQEGVTITMTDAISPITFSGSDWTYLVMPIRSPKEKQTHAVRVLREPAPIRPETRENGGMAL